MMNHVIRTPCNAIIGMNTLLQKMNLSNEQKEYVDTIDSSSNILLGIINSFLDFSKLDSGKIKLEYKPFDLNHVLNTSVKMFKANALYENDIEFKLIVNTDVP